MDARGGSTAAMGHLRWGLIGAGTMGGIVAYAFQQSVAGRTGPASRQGSAWPPSQWDADWDNRADRPGLGPVRHIVLIRHGHYALDSGKLTQLGREQARAVGKRLASWGVQFKGIHSSALPRARETASLIAEALEDVPLHDADEALNEGCPVLPMPPIEGYDPAEEEVLVDGERIEAAFRRYFRRLSLPRASGEVDDEWELVVCHANVIRYFCMRALQLPPDGWNRLVTRHTGLTHIVIHPNGCVYCFSFGDVGHLPPQLTTYF